MAINIQELAEGMGAVHSPGINWTWADKFPSKVRADAFHTVVIALGYETRGVYNPIKPEDGWGVRYRR